MEHDGGTFKVFQRRSSSSDLTTCDPAGNGFHFSFGEEVKSLYLWCQTSHTLVCSWLSWVGQLNALFRLRLTFDWQHALYLFLQNHFSKTNKDLFWSLSLSPCHHTEDLDIKILLSLICWLSDLSLTSVQTPRLCMSCSETFIMNETCIHPPIFLSHTKIFIAALFLWSKR